MKQTILILTLAVIGLTACKQKQTTEIRNDFKKYYDQFNVNGSFVLYDPQTDNYIFYNQNQFEQTFSPASTFKICNSLIGLETGVIKDENFVIPWDSVTRQNPNWNTDHDLNTALKSQFVVWVKYEVRQSAKTCQCRLMCLRCHSLLCQASISFAVRLLVWQVLDNTKQSNF